MTLDATGFIAIDEQMRTTDPRIHAVGDVTHDSGKADYVDVVARIFGELGANSLLQLVGHMEVIEFLARSRIEFE